MRSFSLCDDCDEYHGMYCSLAHKQIATLQTTFYHLVCSKKKKAKTRAAATALAGAAVALASCGIGAIATGGVLAGYTGATMAGGALPGLMHLGKGEGLRSCEFRVEKVSDKEEGSTNKESYKLILLLRGKRNALKLFGLTSNKIRAEVTQITLPREKDGLVIMKLRNAPTKNGIFGKFGWGVKKAFTRACDRKFRFNHDLNCASTHRKKAKSVSRSSLVNEPGQNLQQFNTDPWRNFPEFTSRDGKNEISGTDAFKHLIGIVYDLKAAGVLPRLKLENYVESLLMAKYQRELLRVRYSSKLFGSTVKTGWFGKINWYCEHCERWETQSKTSCTQCRRAKLATTKTKKSSDGWTGLTSFLNADTVGQARNVFMDRFFLMAPYDNDNQKKTREDRTNRIRHNLYTDGLTAGRTCTSDRPETGEVTHYCRRLMQRLEAAERAF